jgi:predicted transcriptional regulator
MAPPSSANSASLSRRERQIMDVIYAAKQATAAQVLAGISDPPSYSAVRALLRILENKGHLRHRQERGKYVYSPTRPRGHVAKSALRNLLKTFFENSTTKAVAALLDNVDVELSEAEFDELTQLIQRARKRGSS